MKITKVFLPLLVALCAGAVVYMWSNELSVSIRHKITISTFLVVLCTACLAPWFESKASERIKRRISILFALTGCSILGWIASPYFIAPLIQQTIIGEFIGVERPPIGIALALIVASCVLVFASFRALAERPEEPRLAIDNPFSAFFEERSLYSRADKPPIQQDDSLYDELELALNRIGRIGVYGRFGSGKSAILRALATEGESTQGWYIGWIDYEHQRKGIDTALSDFVNISGQREIFVVIDNVPRSELVAESSLSKALQKCITQSPVRVRIGVASSKEIPTGFLPDGVFLSRQIASFSATNAFEFVKLIRNEWDDTAIRKLLEHIPVHAYYAGILLRAIELVDTDPDEYLEKEETLLLALGHEILHGIPPEASEVASCLSVLENAPTTEALAALIDRDVFQVRQWLDWCTSYFELEYNKSEDTWSLPNEWKSTIYRATAGREKWALHTAAKELVENCQRDDSDASSGESSIHHEASISSLRIKPSARPGFVVLASLSAFLSLFVIPFPPDGVPAFTYVARSFSSNLSNIAGCVAFAMLLVGAVFSLGRKSASRGKQPATRIIDALRIFALPIGCLFILFDVPDSASVFPLPVDNSFESVKTAFFSIRLFVWDKLACSLAVIVPMGAVFVTLISKLGGITLVGAGFTKPMKKLFGLPGRACLDLLASLLGSYSITMKLTRDLVSDRVYTWRQGLTVAMCFSTVSIGFFYVVVATLQLERVILPLFCAYILTTLTAGAVCCRLPPFTWFPNNYEGGTAAMRDRTPTSLLDGWRQAKFEAARNSIRKVLEDGFFSGMALGARIIGPIIVVTSCALVFLSLGPIYKSIGFLLGWIPNALGVPNGEQLAVGIFGGLFEMYIPAMVSESMHSDMIRGFVVIVSCSEVLFLSGVGMCLFELFSPRIRVRDYLMAVTIRIPVVLSVGILCILGLRWLGFALV